MSRPAYTKAQREERWRRMQKYLREAGSLPAAMRLAKKRDGFAAPTSAWITALSKMLLLALLLLATPALAQQQYDAVDIQVRLGIPAKQLKFPVPDGVVCTGESGTLGQPGYVNCSDHLPYIPARWACITSATLDAYRAGAGGQIRDGNVKAQWVHDHAGHSYHDIPVAAGDPPWTRPTPMAFPPGERVILKVKNLTGFDVHVTLSLAGYLGADATATRERACQ